jgi:hypothetical protein
MRVHSRRSLNLKSLRILEISLLRNVIGGGKYIGKGCMPQGCEGRIVDSSLSLEIIFVYFLFVWYLYLVSWLALSFAIASEKSLGEIWSTPANRARVAGRAKAAESRYVSDSKLLSHSADIFHVTTFDMLYEQHYP